MGSEVYTAVARDNQLNTMNTNEILRDNDDPKIFPPSFTYLPASYVPVIAIHPLGGSCTHRHHTTNPQSGAAQPTQDRDP